MSKTITARIAHKSDLEANWMKSPANQFIPIKGELIIFEAEVDKNGNSLELPSGRTVPYTYARMKVGDGYSTVFELPFIGGTN